jgi:hypothetical protein
MLVLPLAGSYPCRGVLSNDAGRGIMIAAPLALSFAPFADGRRSALVREVCDRGIVFANTLISCGRKSRSQNAVFKCWLDRRRQVVVVLLHGRGGCNRPRSQDGHKHSENPKALENPEKP